MTLGRVPIAVFAVLWYIVWGICLWDDHAAAAQPYYAAHTDHGHAAGHETDGSHHASKGTEHSCTGSAALSTETLSQQCTIVAQADHRNLADMRDVGTGVFRTTHPSRPFFFQASVLPKRFADLSLFYSVFLI